MRIDVFKVKKISPDSENISTEFVTTIDLDVVPRIGEQLKIRTSEDKGREFIGLPTLKVLDYRVVDVVHVATDGKPGSSAVLPVTSAVSLFVS